MYSLDVNNFYFDSAVELEHLDLPKGKGKRTVSEIYDDHDEQQKENFRLAKRPAFEVSSDQITEDQNQTLIVFGQTDNQIEDITCSVIEVLPIEIFHEIFSYLNVRDLVQVERTCKAFRNPCLMIWETRLRELIRTNFAIETTNYVFGLRKGSPGLPEVTPDGEENYAITSHAMSACKVVEYLCPLFEDYMDQLKSLPSLPNYYYGDLRKKDVIDLREEIQLCLGLRVVPSGMQYNLLYVKKGQHGSYILPSINVALLIQTSPRILRILLRSGIPVNNLDNHKNTLNAVLQRGDCRRILPLFIAHGAKPCNGMNNNTLNYAIQHCELHDMLGVLLDLGAAPSRSRNGGTTDTIQSVIDKGQEFTRNFLIMTSQRREFLAGGQYFEFWNALYYEYLKMIPK